MRALTEQQLEQLENDIMDGIEREIPEMSNDSLIELYEMLIDTLNGRLEELT